VEVTLNRNYPRLNSCVFCYTMTVQNSACVLWINVYKLSKLQSSFWNSLHCQWKSRWTVTIPGRTRCVLLHYDSSKHCACPLSKFVWAFIVVKLFLKHPVQSCFRQYFVFCKPRALLSVPWESSVFFRTPAHSLFAIMISYQTIRMVSGSERLGLLSDYTANCRPVLSSGRAPHRYNTANFRQQHSDRK
jgi:hypothetical protein